MIPVAMEVSDLCALRECATRLRLIAKTLCETHEDRYYVSEAETVINRLLFDVDISMDRDDAEGTGDEESCE